MKRAGTSFSRRARRPDSWILDPSSKLLVRNLWLGAEAIFEDAKRADEGGTRAGVSTSAEIFGTSDLMILE